MRSLIAAVFAVSLAASPAVRADAIPMPEQLNDAQLQLIGVWQEEKPLWPTGLGHSYLFRTVAFGSSDMTILNSSGIPPANMYATSAVRGDWTAKRDGDKTLVVTLTQSDARGTTLTLVFDGPDAFTLTDAEADRYGPSRFRRVTEPVKQIDPYR